MRENTHSLALMGIILLNKFWLNKRIFSFKNLIEISFFLRFYVIAKFALFILLNLDIFLLQYSQQVHHKLSLRH